ncbi:unnamed protein product [Haemonchus placei]|uniref:Uncharacterized protein n=1 Tax=Haemonchus placei TaxID=6290 RepID=A0A3P8A4Z4_HAEPC|nr:unnamed protein product [Haemonchus placei]
MIRCWANTVGRLKASYTFIWWKFQSGGVLLEISIVQEYVHTIFLRIYVLHIHDD